MSRRKSIGNKRVDITRACRDLIDQAYSEYLDKTYTDTAEDSKEIICKSKILDSITLGYNKITVESPLLDENGKVIKKKGKPVADPDQRDTENVPLDEDIDTYFEREVKPYKQDAWIDKTKTKVGYEIPFIRTFYVYKPLESTEAIAHRIAEHESILMDKFQSLFGKTGK